MIRGIHGLFYSSDPDATRAFFRDVVRLPGKDTGGGWWIFDFAEGDMGVHPIDDPSWAGRHDVSMYCDDIAGTVADLKARGVAFTHDVADHGYGLVTYFTAPGGITVQLYEPRYKKLKRVATLLAKARRTVKRLVPKRRAAKAAARTTRPAKRTKAKRAAPKRKLRVTTRKARR